MNAMISYKYSLKCGSDFMALLTRNPSWLRLRGASNPLNWTLLKLRSYFCGSPQTCPLLSVPLTHDHPAPLLPPGQFTACHQDMHGSQCTALHCSCLLVIGSIDKRINHLHPRQKASRRTVRDPSTALTWTLCQTASLSLPPLSLPLPIGD